ncbi:hypothetical protein SteCoe_27478 [Stentor coeruleus]|uniref:Uncharacterized protein n=1 Tax=Stentor coeruleus TaxID=5963 RepID=A0A1R2BAI5_9CILI|nr:hypothetical protein SteCoe_27478 [Stentor coeruleus]
MSIKTKIIELSEAVVKVLHLKQFGSSKIAKQEDLEQVFIRKGEKLANFIAKLSNRDDIKIDYICEKFIKSLQKIIINLECDKNTLINQTKRLFQNYHSAIETKRIELLNIFFSKAENQLNFHKEIKKNFIFKVKFEDEKMRFLGEYIFRDIVRISDFVKNFNDFFKPFFSSEPVNIDLFFNELEFELTKSKTENTEILVREVNNLFQAVWRKIVYQQCDLVMFEMPGKDQAINITNDWNIAFSFVQVNCKMTMYSVTEMSDEDLIIVLCNGSLNYIVYYNGQQGMILKIFKADILQIASGSTLSNIVIWQYPQNTCYIYSLENGKLIEKTSIDLCLGYGEIISHIVFTPELSKLVYVVNGNQFHSLAFKKLRANITLNLNNEPCTSMKYSHDSRFIVIKSENNIKILNDYLIMVYDNKLLGDKIIISKNKKATFVLSKYKNSIIILKIKNQA